MRKYIVYIVVALLFQCCKTKIEDISIYANKYDFIQKEKFELLDSFRLPGLNATLYTYRHSGKNHAFNCELLKPDSLGEIIYIPAKSEGINPFLHGSDLYNNYDFNYIDLERYLNENKKKFINIEKYENDLKIIFKNNIILREYPVKNEFVKPVLWKDSMPMDEVPKALLKQAHIYSFNHIDSAGRTYLEQIIFITPPIEQDSGKYSKFSATGFFYIRDRVKYIRGGTPKE